jgi:hypothetical protein
MQFELKVNATNCRVECELVFSYIAPLFEGMRRIMNFRLFSLLLFLATFCFHSLAQACEPCAVYSATELHGFSERSTSLVLSEVLSEFDVSGRTPRLREGEILERVSVTNLSVAADLSERWSAQLSLPFIARDFIEFESFRRREDTETGIGDVSIYAQFVPILIKELDYTLYFAVSAGLKLPTGDTDSLGETSTSQDSRLFHHVGGAGVSASQGRGLSLGSGSIDYLLGAKMFLRSGRAFLFGGLQYGIRTEGDFEYEFADDIVWNIGPGYYLYMGNHDLSVALRAVLSGEDKANDHQGGDLVNGTSISNVYLGSELLLTFYGRYSSELGIDLPISTSSSALEEPEFKLRASLGVRF